MIIAMRHLPPGTSTPARTGPIPQPSADGLDRSAGNKAPRTDDNRQSSFHSDRSATSAAYLATPWARRRLSSIRTWLRPPSLLLPLLLQASATRTTGLARRVRLHHIPATATRLRTVPLGRTGTHFLLLVLILIHLIGIKRHLTFCRRRYGHCAPLVVVVLQPTPARHRRLIVPLRKAQRPVARV